MTYVREMRNVFEKGNLNKNFEDYGSKSVSEKVLDVALKIS